MRAKAPGLRPFAVFASALSLVLGSASCSDEGALASVPSVEPFLPPASSESPPSALEPAPPPAPEPVATIGEGMPAVSLPPPPPAPAESPEVREEAPPRLEQPALEPPIACTPLGNSGSLTDTDINVNLATELQTISGFGGINVPGWIDDLTPEQAQTAFGRGADQLGLSLLRVRIPFDPDDFAAEVPTAQRALALGARVFATPWTPPANLKTNNNTVGGELARANYGAYAAHLLAFRDFMADNRVPLAALSLQNEPDIDVDYESCDWTAAQLSDFLIEQGSRFGDTRLIAAESFNFNRQMTDPLLNNAAAAAQFEIVGGHVYGSGLSDYPLARQRGKEVWMTEHYTDSNNSANAWPNALNVGAEIQDSMRANFNAYVWWYIRRSYGLLTEDGRVSKRGYLMSQYARFVRPGYVRVAASQPPATTVQVTAFKNGPGRVVVVALNESTAAQTVNLDVFGSCVTGFNRFTTSQTKNAAADGQVNLANGRVSVTLDASSLTTFVSR